MYGFSGKNQEKMRNTTNVVKSKHFSHTFVRDATQTFKRGYNGIYFENYEYL